MVEETHRVIATGGVVRIANSCLVKEGKLTEVNLPSKFLPRVQVLEYMRAFLLGRMGWSKLDGLLLISGAFGMFDKEIVLMAGGYNCNTVGEDMELIIRMRRMMREHGLPYKVKYISEPLCWTEAPDTTRILIKQRNRWTRGTMETLWLHKKICFNPKYGFLGLVSYPYWLLCEYMAPLIEVAGLTITLLSVIFGLMSWAYFFAFLSFVYAFVVMLSMLALVVDEFISRQYRRRSELFFLILTALLEPVFFHPLAVYSAVKGNIQKLRGTGGWGEMTRSGFKTV